MALEELKKQGANPDKIAVIGYCFGGTGALETARAGFSVAGVVSIHGGLAKGNDRLNVPIKTKVLVENPADDESVKPEKQIFKSSLMPIPNILSLAQNLQITTK